MAAPKKYGGRWTVVEPIGKFGQSRTYKVRRADGDDTVFVLKELLNARRHERFVQEVLAVQSLSHPNVIRIEDFEFSGPRPFMVSEFCAQGSLEDCWTARNGTLRALKIIGQVCDGLAEAHRSGLVHRDIKPANILMRSAEGPAVLADFGLCYVVDGARHTLTHEQVGSRFYMAPELADGRAEFPQPSADTYSLGKVLYWMLTGDKFDREKHRDAEFDLVRISGEPRLEHVNRLLDHMITVDPSLRYPDGEAAGAALRDVARLFAGGFNALSPGLPQRCTYCGQGVYQDGRDPEYFGIRGVGSDTIRVLWCPECGHSQIFRVREANRKDWWGL